MPAQKFLSHNGSGMAVEVEAAQSGGAGNEDKVVALDGSGRLDESMMPTGIGPEGGNFQAVGAIGANELVNIFLDGGVRKMRKADATNSLTPANGFVKAAVANNATGFCHFNGILTGLSGLTGEKAFLGTTAGAVTSTAPTGSTNIVQVVGVIASETSIYFEAKEPILLA